MNDLDHRTLCGLLPILLGVALNLPGTQAEGERALFQHSRAPDTTSAESALARFRQRSTTHRVAVAGVDTSAFEDNHLILNPFPGVALEATPASLDFSGAVHQTRFAHLANQQGSAVFIVRGSRLSGKINSAQGSFEVFPLQDGECIIVQHKPGSFPQDGTGNLAPARRIPTTDPSASPSSLDNADPVSVSSSGAASTEVSGTLDSPLQNHIRVIVAYTEGAQLKTRLIYGRTMQEQVDLFIAESNQGYANSGVSWRLELACLYQTDSSESTAIENDVADFRNEGDGRFDEVHQLRADYDADMCCLITDGRDYTWCGWSYGFDYTSRDNMFQATSYACATGNFSVAHEFGHLQGCRHNDDLTLFPFPYGHGYRNESYWRTIMALANNTTAPRLNHWSNPDLTSPVFPYTPMGTPVDEGNFANDCCTALNIGADIVINHETTPTTATVPTNASIDDDEYADKIVTDTLTVGAFSAQSGAVIRLRAGRRIVIQPGFHACVGSQLKAQLSDPLGLPLESETPIVNSPEESDKATATGL